MDGVGEKHERQKTLILRRAEWLQSSSAEALFQSSVLLPLAFTRSMNVLWNSVIGSFLVLK